MDNEMIERCKAELERCFDPAINFKAPYAKVMSDMAVKAIIKAMREPTENMVNKGNLAIAANLEANAVFKNMIDAVIND